MTRERHLGQGDEGTRLQGSREISGARRRTGGRGHVPGEGGTNPATVGKGWGGQKQNRGRGGVHPTNRGTQREAKGAGGSERERGKDSVPPGTGAREEEGRGSGLPPQRGGGGVQRAPQTWEARGTRDRGPRVRTNGDTRRQHVSGTLPLSFVSLFHPLVLNSTRAGRTSSHVRMAASTSRRATTTNTSPSPAEPAQTRYTSIEATRVTTTSCPQEDALRVTPRLRAGHGGRSSYARRPTGGGGGALRPSVTVYDYIDEQC